MQNKDRLDLVDGVLGYLKSLCGVEGTVRDNRSDLKLSAYVASPYDFWLFSGQESPFEIMALKASVTPPPSPGQIASHIAAVSDQLGGGVPVVFAAGRMEAYNRKRLVERRIPFVVPRRQLYLPFMNMAFSDVGSLTVKEYDSLGVPAQMLLLAELNIPSGGMTIDEAASLIGYTRMSVMKAFNELEYFGFARRDRVSHKLVFRTDRRMLFEDAKKVMRNPRRKIVPLDELPKGLMVVESGTCALSRISMIAPPGYREVAARSADFRKLGKCEVVPSAEAKFRLELWSYPPAFLFKDRIDPLSLILSLSGETDERIVGEIEDALEGFKW